MSQAAICATVTHMNFRRGVGELALDCIDHNDGQGLSSTPGTVDSGVVQARLSEIKVELDHQLAQVDVGDIRDEVERRR
jgi:hypothetical protein